MATLLQKKSKLTVWLSLLAVMALAQSPIVKVDMNMSGRPELETNDPNYLPWIPEGTSSAITANGVTFTLKKAGSNGSALRMTYYKAGIQQPSYARLGSDAVYIDGGNAGAQIEMVISGLPAGTHSLMTFHNSPDNPETNTFAPINIFVNGSQVLSNVAHSARALTLETTQSSYITFNATAGQNVTIAYRAVTNGSQNNKNVYINGFELNTPDMKNQAKSPIPTDGDMHMNGDAGTATLKWTAGNGATKHRIYYGTDKNCVTTGSTTSSCYKGEQTGTSFNVSGLYSMDTYYWRVDEVTSAGVVTKGNVWVFRPRQLAFPGAEGYGRFAIGGRGGKVIHVTNLNDSGAGSLRDAVENQTGARTIVFDISGVIALNSRLVLSDPYVTIAGQTAPGKGICIRKAPMGFTGNDVIARHMKVRLGAGPTFDGMGLTGANHSILDHCSISWTIDESFSSRSGKNITLQRTLISEALNAAGHQNYPAGTEHGYAATIGGDIGSFHHNLLAHCYGRNWSLGGGLDGNAYYAGRLDITNNVVYNWGGRTTDGGAMEVNFVNNYYKPGAGSKIFVALSMDHENTGLGMQRAYFSGNVMPGYFNESNQTAGRRETFSNGDSKKYDCFVNTPFFPSYVTTQSATDAYKSVLSDVGQNQPLFDDHDIRIVDEALNGTYKYKGSVTGKPGFPDKESDVGGYENYPALTRAANWDTDKDGLPDFWEKSIGTSTSSPSGNFSDSNADPDKNGYTNLEEYLNWMAEPHYFVTVPNIQNIDLTAMFKGYSKTSPTYTVASVVNGSVTISGSTATFKPSACGFASFNLTVKDNAGATMTKKIGVHVDGTCTASNNAPVVSITAPANNASYTAGTTIEITANSTDSDGSVAKVEFYKGTDLLGSDAATPFSFTWSGAAAGTYSITAVATDDKGAKSTSQAIIILVNAKPTDCAGVENGTATLDNCSRCTGGTTGKTACTSASEAEDDACSFDGVTEAKNAGFKGTSYINVPNEIGSGITFSINASAAGKKTLSFRYASGGTSDRAATIKVNGTVLPGTLSFPATGDFTTYKAVDINLTLNEGNNIIQLISATTDGLANIDQIGYVSAGVRIGSCDEIITNVTERSGLLKVEMYPNPSSSTFQIRTSDITDIEITDMEGKRLIFFCNVSELQFGDDLQSGIYFARIQNKVYKLVKY